MNKIQTVLVTGSTGFIGRALCKRLLSDKMLVRGAMRGRPADLPSGTDSAVRIDAIGPDTDWSTALKDVDIVVHLAARVHVMEDTVDDPISAYRQVNVAGTERLARSAVEAGVKRFIYLSSVKVLGEECVDPYTEETIPHPKDPYGVSKWEAEQILGRVAEDTGLEVVILRPPLVYGPGVKANFLNLMKIVEKGIPLPFASIDNCRSFVYLGNLIDAIVASVTHPKAVGQTYLVSDGEDISTPELVLRIADALGRPKRLIPFPPALMRAAGKMTGKSGAVDRLLGSLVVDSRKIQTELGWEPPYSMNNGLDATAQWYKTVR